MSVGEISQNFNTNSNPSWDGEITYFNADNIKTESVDCEENGNDTSTQDDNPDIKVEDASIRTRKRVKNYLYLHMYGQNRVDGVDSSDDEGETLVPERIIKTKVPKKARPRTPSISIDESAETSAHSPKPEEGQSPVTKQRQVSDNNTKVSSYSVESGSEPASGESEGESETNVSEPETVEQPKRPYRPRAKRGESKKKDKSLCYICGKILANHRSLNLHIQSHNGPAWLYCKVCSKKFPSIEEREIHFNTTHDPNEKTIMCKYCGAYFATIYSRQKHVSKIHKELRFLCQFCGKKFVTKEKMECHVGSIHDGRKNYICPVCGKAYSQKVTLNYHLRTHSDNTNPFKCGICGITYTYKYTMLNHVKAKHTEDGKMPVKCCDKCLTGFPEDEFDIHDCNEN